MYYSNEFLAIQVGDNHIACPKNGGIFSSVNYNWYNQYSFIYINQKISINNCFGQVELNRKCPEFFIQYKENNGFFIYKEDYSLLDKDENSQKEIIIFKDITSLTNWKYYHKKINSYTICCPFKENLSLYIKCSNGNIYTECENKYKFRICLCRNNQIFW